MKKKATKAVLTITENSGKIDIHLVRGKGEHNQGDNPAFMVGMLMTKMFHELAEKHCPDTNATMEVK